MQEHQVTVARQPLPARPAVLRPRDPEPARDGGHLSPARGPARPLPVQGHGPVPVGGGPDRDHGPDDRRGVGPGPEGRDGGRDRRDAAARPGRPDRAAHHRLRGQHPRRDPPRPAAGAASSSASTSATAARRAAPRRSSRPARSSPCSTAASTSRSTTSGPLALPSLRHRIILNFEGEAEGITTEAVGPDDPRLGRPAGGRVARRLARTER